MEIEEKMEELYRYIWHQDKYKEEFLQQITEKYGAGNLLKAENENYRLVGLPLFNKKEERVLREAFNKQLLE